MFSDVFIFFLNPDFAAGEGGNEVVKEEKQGWFSSCVNRVFWGTKSPSDDIKPKEECVPLNKIVIKKSTPKKRKCNDESCNYSVCEEGGKDISFEKNERKRKKPLGSSMTTRFQRKVSEREAEERKASEREAVKQVINRLLEDPDFILPGTKWGKNNCANNLKNTVKLITGLAAALFCPVNSLFISNEPWKTRLLAAMGTVPLSASFNFQLIDQISHALSVLNEKGVLGAPIDYLKNYREKLREMSTYEKGRSVLSTMIKPASALYGGYWYALSDSLSAEQAGIVVGKQLGLSDSGIATMKAVTRWGNFYYTSLAGAMFYLGAVDLLSAQIFRCDKNLEQEKLKDILAKLDGMTDEKEQEDYLRSIQFNSIVDLMDLQSENFDASLINTDKGHMLVNLVSAAAEIALTLLLPQANNDTFSSKRILANACDLGLTVAGSAVHYDQRIALGTAIVDSACCSEAIKNVGDTPTSTIINSGCAVASSSGVEAFNEACQGVSFPASAIVNNSTCSAVCDLASSPNCRLPLLEETAKGLETASNLGLMSGLFQGAGLVCKTLLTARAGMCLAVDLMRYKKTGVVESLRRVPASVYAWKALGYGEMAVCMWFYQTNVYLIMPIAHAGNILHTVVKQKPLFGATPSTFISMTILGVPFMEGGEVLSELSKGGYRMIKAQTWDRVKNCFFNQEKTPEHLPDVMVSSGLMPAM